MITKRLKSTLASTLTIAAALIGITALVSIDTEPAYAAYHKRRAVQSAGAETVESAPQYITIPVMYVTDRELKGEGFGAHRRYPSNCQHEMYYGTALVTIKNTEHKNDHAVFEKLGWQATEQKPGKFAPKNFIDPSDAVKSKAIFFDKVRGAIDQTGKNELCLFVHGAADAFEDCAQDAALLAYSIQKPVVLYSWPSDPKWRGYFIDSTNNEWSQGHFDIFMNDLLEFRKSHPLEVLSFSHSMGNRLVIRALPVVYGKGLITMWSLISPDMDTDTCKHYLLGTKPHEAKIRLYVSNRDKMLPLSQMLAGGYYRLGEAANPVAEPTNWKDHHLNAGAIERIDFTDIDKGLTGHTIPFDLVANIINNNSPGPGLELVPENEVRGNRLVKFADRSQHLDRLTKGLPDQFCKKVIRVKE